MIWFPAWLSLSGALSAVSCSMVPVHPWTFGVGHQEESGSYLSPANAIAYLLKKLETATGEHEVIVLMAAETTTADFMTTLNQLTAVFPLPMLKQVERLAQTAAELAISKMQIPAITSALPAPAPLSVGTCRAAMAAQASAQAQAAASGAMDAAAIGSALDELKRIREQAATDSAGSLTELQKGRAALWAFRGKGDVNMLATALKKEIPQQSAIYTAAVMLVSDDLTAIGSMLTCRELS